MARTYGDDDRRNFGTTYEQGYGTLEELGAPAPGAELRTDGIGRLPSRLFEMWDSRNSLPGLAAGHAFRMEGTPSSLSDLPPCGNDEAPGGPAEAVREVSNYVAAMNHGLERMRSGFPLSLRLVREIHKILLSKGRERGKQPGEFRRAQNWIGGSRPGDAVLVPPLRGKLKKRRNQFELFSHDEPTGPPLLTRAGLAHVQLRTIHSCPDGNGRLGRLLINSLLCAHGALREPILYLSLSFKTNRAVGCELLDRVRAQRDWGAWLAFFLVGVRDTAEQAAKAAHEILDLFHRDRKKMEALGRPAGSTLRVCRHMQRNPSVAIPATARRKGISAPTVAKSLGNMTDLGILEGATGHERRRLFVYRRCVEVLNQGAEPLRSIQEGNACQVNFREAVRCVQEGRVFSPNGRAAFTGANDAKSTGPGKAG